MINEICNNEPSLFNNNLTWGDLHLQQQLLFKNKTLLVTKECKTSASWRRFGGILL